VRAACSIHRPARTAFLKAFPIVYDLRLQIYPISTKTTFCTSQMTNATECVPHILTTPDSVTLSVQEWGNASGPEILFIHGICQSHLSWRKQYESKLGEKFRLITYDMRGHGASSKPLEAASYQENHRWAQEVDCVLQGLNLKRPVLVGWSYAGRVICDYLMTYGDDSIAGINFVNASTKTAPEFASPGGKILCAMTSEDLITNIRSTQDFLRICSSQPISPEDFETMLAYNMLTPAKARLDMLTRATPYEEHLKKVKVPVLITHGEKDQVVISAVARYTASVIPHAKTSFYPDCAHMPFWEDSSRFNHELAEFLHSIR
jgi:non-heme chloroperoxidase